MKLHLKQIKKLTTKMCQGDIRSQVSKLIDQVAQMHIQGELKHMEEVKDFKTQIKELKDKNKGLQKSLKHADSIMEPSIG